MFSINQSLSRKTIIFFTAIILIVGIVVFYNSIKYKIINQQVGELISKESKGLYTVQYDSIAIDEIGGNLTLTNIRLTPDTTRQLRMLKNGDTSAAKMLLSVFIPRIEVTGFKTARALLSQQLICNSIRIIDPQAIVYIFPSKNKEQANEQPQSELYKQILGNLKLIYADSVSIINSQVHALDFFSKQTKFYSFKTTVNLQQVRIDSAYYHDKTRTLFSKNIKVYAERVLLGEKGKEAELLNLEFDTDTEQLLFSSLEYDAYKAKGSFKSRMNGVVINGLEWKGAAEYSTISLKDVVVNKMMFETTSSGESSHAKKPSPILSGWIKDFDLRRLEIKSFGLTSKSMKPGAKDITVNNSALLLQNVHLDTTAVFDETLFNKVKNLQLNNKLVEFISEDKLYKYQLVNLNLNTDKKTFIISEIRIVPQLNETAFARKSIIQKDRYEMVAKNIVCKNIDIGRLAKLEMYIKELMVNSVMLKVYRDQHMPPDKSSKIGHYPHQLLMKLIVPIKIDKIFIRNANIFYRENSAVGDSIGTVAFNSSGITVTNANNTDIKKGETAVVDFTTLFLNKILLKGKFTFFLDEWERGKFNVKANVGNPFDAKLINSVSIPLSLTQLDKGAFTMINFNIDGDNNLATGSLQLTYNNLKISLLKRKEEALNRKTLFSLLANLVVKNNNRRADMRVQAINFQRDPTKSIFNFIWKAIFSGAREILGIKL